MWKKKYKNSYSKVVSKNDINYYLKYLGESKSYKQPILVEIINFKTKNINSACLISRLDLNTSEKILIKDLSVYYNNNLIKEITKI
jgi:hypothetical protein